MVKRFIAWCKARFAPLPRGCEKCGMTRGSNSTCDLCQRHKAYDETYSKGVE